MSDHPFALQYDCGCIYEWMSRHGWTGLYLTDPCDQHKHLYTAAGDAPTPPASAESMPPTGRTEVSDMREPTP